MKKRVLSAGLLAAIASSLCCIAPLIAIFAGISGLASSFSWIAPARPYLIGISILALGMAFYFAYKPATAEDCACAVPEKKSFLNSKGFLWFVALFAIGMFCFPHFANNFYSQETQLITTADSTKTVQFTLKIKGMTCAACENYVQSTLIPMDGMAAAKASYKNGNAIIQVDTSKTSIAELKVSLEEETGYKVVDVQLEN